MISKLTLEVAKQHPNRSVPLYLMASYAYYVEDKPILEDHEFDQLAKFMLDNWDNVKHNHKYKITEDMLKAGTYLGDYPSIVEGALEYYRSDK